PVIPESVLMVAAQVVGNDTTITLAGMSGVFELNVMMPLIAYNLLQSIEILGNVAGLLAERCVDGIQANVERCEELVEKSIAKDSVKTGKTVRELCRERKVLPEDELNEALDPWGMTEGGIHAGGGGGG